MRNPSTFMSPGPILDVLQSTRSSTGFGQIAATYSVEFEYGRPTLIETSTTGHVTTGDSVDQSAVRVGTLADWRRFQRQRVVRVDRHVRFEWYPVTGVMPPAHDEEFDQKILRILRRHPTIRHVRMDTQSGVTVVRRNDLAFGYPWSLVSITLTSRNTESSGEIHAALFVRSFPETLLKEVAEGLDLAVTLHETKPAPSHGKPRTVCLLPFAAGQLWEVFVPLCFADNVQSGTSVWTRSDIGTMMAREDLVITDSGSSPGAPVTYPVDDEGSRAVSTTIIQGGKLRGFLHNRATAQEFGVAPTGNGRRLNYRNTPTVGLTNFRARTTETIPQPDEGWFGVEWSHIVCDPNSNHIEGTLVAYENTAKHGFVPLPRIRVKVTIDDLLMSVQTIRSTPKWCTTPSIEGTSLLLTASALALE